MDNERDQARHPATLARLRRARTTGQVAISRELALGLLWLGGVAVLLTFAGRLGQDLVAMANSNWSQPITVTDDFEPWSKRVAQLGGLFWKSWLPVLAALALIGYSSLAIQTRFEVFPALVRPSLDRINPIQNAGRMFSLSNWLKVIFGLVKLTGLTCLAWWILAGDAEWLVAASGLPLQKGFVLTGVYFGQLLMKLAVVICLMGLADYGIRWWHLHLRLRMTDQQVRDDQRAAEAPPEVGARRRLLAGDRRRASDPGSDSG